MDIINELARVFSKKFPFGIHSEDDIYQQAWVFCLEALEKFDPNRSNLRSYLFSVLYSRFINFKRNEYYRSETPCKSCPFSRTYPTSSSCEVFSCLSDCPVYREYLQRNTAKKSASCATFEINLDCTSHEEIPLCDYPEHLHELILRASSGEKINKAEKTLLRNYFEK